MLSLCLVMQIDGFEIFSQQRQIKFKRIITSGEARSAFVFPAHTERKSGFGRGLVGSSDDLPQAATTVATSALVAFLALSPLPAHAADGYLSDPQHLVAEAWKQVDKRFVDRTFNGHEDWFKLRQDYVHRNYRSSEEAYSAVEELLGNLGDKYTRFLPPAKFDSVVNSATASVGGVGIEIIEDLDGTIRCGDIIPGD